MLWGMPNRTWGRLYRILEEIERHLGAKVHLKNLCTLKERGRFASSANNARVAGVDSRHADGKYEPPNAPMTIDEATAFIRDLILASLK